MGKHKHKNKGNNNPTIEQSQKSVQTQQGNPNKKQKPNNNVAQISNQTNVPEKPKRRIAWRIIKWCIILLIIAIFIFSSYRYSQEVGEESYIKGGQAAINKIIDEANTNGGVIIKSGDNSLVLSKYTKPLDELTEETNEETTEEATNTTE